MVRESLSISGPRILVYPTLEESTKHAYVMYDYITDYIIRVVISYQIPIWNTIHILEYQYAARFYRRTNCHKLKFH